MITAQLLQEIYSSVWLVSGSTKFSYRPMVKQLMSGETMPYSELKEVRADMLKRTAPMAAVVGNGGAFNIRRVANIDEAPHGSMAIININGLMTKGGGLSSKGTIDSIGELEAAGANNKIKGVLLRIDSGGGSVNGTENLANTVGMFESKYGKPLVGFIDGTAASAAYWTISQAPVIFANGLSAEAGSIGVMVTIFDDRELMAMEGVKEIIIRATESTGKNEEYLQALEGNMVPMQQNILDPINKAFQTFVKNGRGEKLNTKKYDIFSGAVYFGEDLVKSGLADKIGTLDESIAFLSRRAKRLFNN